MTKKRTIAEKSKMRKTDCQALRRAFADGGPVEYMKRVLSRTTGGRVALAAANRIEDVDAERHEDLQQAGNDLLSDDRVASGGLEAAGMQKVEGWNLNGPDYADCDPATLLNLPKALVIRLRAALKADSSVRHSLLLTALAFCKRGREIQEEASDMKTDLLAYVQAIIDFIDRGSK
jgi:hypothetical protein